MLKFPSDEDRRLIGHKVFRNSLVISGIAALVLTGAIIVLLWISTELGTGHFLKAAPIVVVLIFFSALCQYLMFGRWLKQTYAFDELFEQDKNSENLGQQALLAQEELVRYPLRSAFLIFVLWFFGALILMGALMVNWGEIFFLWEAVFVALNIIMGGAVAMVFHFYFLRKSIRRTAKSLLEFETGYHLSQAEVGVLNLRRKLRLSFMPAVMAGLVVMAAMGFFQTAIIIRETYSRELTRLKAAFVDQKWSLEDLQKQIDSLTPLVGVNIFLVDEQGLDPVTSTSILMTDDPKETAKFVDLLKGVGDGISFYRVNSKLMFLLTSIGTFNDKREFLGMVYDWDKFLGLELKMLGIFGVIIVILVFLAWYVLMLISNDMIDPLDQMMAQTQRVSHGDLSVDFNIISDDEMGVLAGTLKGMVLNLRDLIERVSNSYEQVRKVITEIMNSSDTVARGTEEQTGAIGDTSQNIGQVNQAVKEVSDNIEVLHNSGQETMQRSEEMIRLVEDVGISLEELGKAVEVSSSSIYEMSVAIKQVAGNVEELNRRSNETSQAVVEMQRNISQVADSSRQSREISEHMRKSAEQGVKAVQETIQGISTIEDTVGQARSTLENLGKSTDQIGKILKVIREVANRTNLLALNAAIIAAQAGEQGQGFAVVADEIKNLADRVANSTIKIDQIIKKVQEDTVGVISVMEKTFQQVETGVNLSYEAGMSLERIVKAVEQSFTMAGQISQATDQQVESASKATKEISSIAELIQQIAVSTREQSKGADQMAKAGTDIKKFTELVLSRSRKQSEEAQKVQVAMENVEQMIKFILNSQHGQAEASERIVSAISKVKNIALRNAQSVGDLDKNIAILNQQSEVLKGVLKQFRTAASEPEPAAEPDPEPDKV